MKKSFSLKGYKKRYKKHVEAITNFQSLIAIEEQKLFKLIKKKKKIFAHKKRKIAQSGCVVVKLAISDCHQ